MLHITLVQSHLTYCSQLWRPRFLKDIAHLERIQRKSTKYILGDYASNYKERLTTLNLLPLMYTGSICKISCSCWSAWKIQMTILTFRGILLLHQPEPEQLLTTNYSSIIIEHPLLKYFYFNRVVKLWNKIPYNILDLSLSLGTLKMRLHHYLWTNFITCFDPDRVCSFQLICPCSKCM